MIECLYEVHPWKEEDELNFSPCVRYREALELGNEYYPEGFDIVEYYPEEEGV